MTLRLRIGRKGYVILPKAIREAVGIEEGDEVLVEVRDGIILRPLKGKVNADDLKEALRKHAEKLRSVKGRREPKPGELGKAHLEEEFDEDIH